MTPRIPRQRRMQSVPAVRTFIEQQWRSWGMSEEEVAEASSHLVIEFEGDKILLRWDDPHWLDSR